MPRATVPLPLGLRVQQWGAQVLGALPPRVQLRLSGKPPVQIDGETLAPEVQLILAVLDRRARAAARDPLAGRRQGGAPAPDRGVRGQAGAGRIGRATSRSRGATAGAAPRPPLLPARARRPPPAARVLPRRRVHLRRPRHARRRVPRSSAATPARTCWRSTTAWRPSTRFPPRSRMRAPRSGGRSRTPSRLGADPGRVGVGGDSAGGNLAAVVSQLAARDGGPAPALQLLIYPATDLTTRRRSRELFGEGFLLTDLEMDWFEDNYLGTREDSRERSPGVAAARRRPIRARAGVRRDRRRSTRCATRARPTLALSKRPARRPRYAASPASSTASSTAPASAAPRATRWSRSRARPAAMFAATPVRSETAQFTT